MCRNSSSVLMFSQTALELTHSLLTHSQTLLSVRHPHPHSQSHNSYTNPLFLNYSIIYSWTTLIWKSVRLKDLKNSIKKIRYVQAMSSTKNEMK